MRQSPDTSFIDADLERDVARSVDALDSGVLPDDDTLEPAEHDTPPPRAATGRRDVLSVAASAGFHAAIAALFFLGPAGGAKLLLDLAGKKDTGITAAGDAAADATKGAQPQPETPPIHVTLVPPPKPRVAPHHPVSPTPPLVRPRPTPQAKAEQPPTPKPQQPAPKPPAAETAPQILASPTPSANGSAAPVQKSAREKPKDTPAKPEDTPATKVDTAKADPTPPPDPKQQPQQEPPQQPPPQQPAEQQAQPPQQAVPPTPTPRPAPPVPRVAQAMAAGDPLAIWRGALTGELSGTAASTDKGRAKAGSGNAAVSNYPGTVARKLQAALHYPPAAARRGITGEARIHFVVEASGAVRDVRLVASSGSDLLDRAAVETVRRAAPLPPIPKAAGRSQWSFTAPVSFSRANAPKR